MGPHATPRLVVDNSNGSDAAFADELLARLRGDGFEVELRSPDPGAFFDTSVHIVADGVAVRVMDEADPATIERVARVIRESERRRAQRKRYRSVPMLRRETGRVVRWVDIFDTDAV